MSSLILLQYFEEKYPDKKPLLPADLLKRATVRQVKILCYKHKVLCLFLKCLVI